MIDKLEIINVSGLSEADQINATARSMLQLMDPSTPHLNLASLAKLFALQLIVLQREPHSLTMKQADEIMKEYRKVIKGYLKNPGGTVAGLRDTGSH